tara:strand:- start:1543 stop:2172 length:630 start_codon:yes stop_codon:yes gene_type:complete
MPVEPATLVTFIAAAFVVVISPGPDTLIILRYTLTSGRRVGLATVTGVQLGLLVHTTAAAAGLSLIIVSRPALYGTIAVIGALYLAWLGYQSIRAGVVSLGESGGSAISAAKGMRDAAVTNVLNPKVIFLFLALMPNFVRPEQGNVPLQFATLAVTLIVVNTIWQGSIALMAEAARGWLAEARIQRMVSWVTGLILIAFAIGLITEHAI